MYERIEVQDHVTIMNKKLYDNLQDGIDESKEEVKDHKKQLIASEVGSHNFRYHNNAFQFYDVEKEEWLDINLEKVVSNNTVIKGIGNDTTAFDVGLFKLEEDQDINEYIQTVLYPTLSVGMNTVVIDSNGSQRFVIVSKTSDEFGAYIMFGHNQELRQYKLTNSVWSIVDFNSGSSSDKLNKTTTFNEDGSIVETTEFFTKTTTFSDDGSVIETTESVDGTITTKTTTFNEDGSISEVFE